jgi:hypothetical protein
MQTTEILVVRQTATRSVEVERTISIEVPAGLRDLARIEPLINRGDKDYGPFRYEPIEGTERVENHQIVFVGFDTANPDIPLMQKGVGA